MKNTDMMHHSTHNKAPCHHPSNSMNLVGVMERTLFLLHQKMYSIDRFSWQ
jgi:hypothetical protein